MPDRSGTLHQHVAAEHVRHERLVAPRTANPADELEERAAARLSEVQTPDRSAESR